MEMRNRANQVPGEAVRRSQLEKLDDGSATVFADNPWQLDAAAFLLRSGFMPGDTTGEVHHVANPDRAGRTFGSVWNAMRILIDRASERTDRAAQVEDHPTALK